MHLVSQTTSKKCNNFLLKVKIPLRWEDNHNVASRICDRKVQLPKLFDTTESQDKMVTCFSSKSCRFIRTYSNPSETARAFTFTFLLNANFEFRLYIV